MDLNADLGALSVAELLERQQELSRTRIEVNAAQRSTQAELDRRQREIADRRAAEDQLLGQVSKPPTQHLLGTPELEAGS